MEKLNKLLSDCRQDKLEDVDRKIETVVESLSTEELVEALELSDQPLVFDVEDQDADPEVILLHVVMDFVEDWLCEQLDHDICHMPYGEYRIIVDHWLDREGAESTSEEEMAQVDQAQCDMELPHRCAREIRKARS